MYCQKSHGIHTSTYRTMYVVLTCCWSRLYVSIRKVLRPATSAQVLLGFPVSISEFWYDSLYSKLLLHASHAAHQDQFKTPPKFMFVMFDMYVKLPPDASPIAVNKFYFTLLYFIT